MVITRVLSVASTYVHMNVHFFCVYSVQGSVAQAACNSLRSVCQQQEVEDDGEAS